MTDSAQQRAMGSGIAQASSPGASATVNIGYTAEQLALMIQAAAAGGASGAGTALQAKYDALATQLNTTSEAVRGFLKILKEEDVPPEQLAPKLTLIAERHVSQLARLAALDPEDTEARKYLDEARELISRAASSADYDRADQLLCLAEEAQDRTLSKAEELEREAHQAAGRLRHGMAATRAERAELSLTRLDSLQAAQHFQAAADLIPAEDISLKLEYLHRSALALYSYGDEKGDNAVLARAISLYRQILAQQERERVPHDWARTQNNLGGVLFRLGERESGTEKLEEAVAAYHQALKEYTRERAPLEWAMTQNNLGTALQTLGERENDAEKLERAVAAFLEALKERTRERVPLNWATTQNNLGIALWRLGERENGTEKLEEAVAAYHEALKERTRERVPLDWAQTQNNLGIALARLGEREGGTGKLEEAVSAYHEALKERTRERVPLDWAQTQNNLGGALVRLGERESGTEKLEEAVAAFQEALKERTRERVPLDWATTQNNLGIALRALGERKSGAKGISLLEEAAAAIQSSCDVYQKAGMHHYNDDFQSRLQAIEQLIASRRSV